MHIDWFVFFAQIVNFLILVWLLKKFLYGKIINAIDVRESKIADTFAEAENSRKEARESSLQYDRQLQELQNRSDEMLNKSRLDAEAYRAELMENVREEVERLHKRWIDTLQSERETFFHELRKLTAAQVYSVTRRVLKDLADIDLEQRIMEILTERIDALTLEEKEKIRSSLASENDIITISSAFDIPSLFREKLAGSIKKNIGMGIEVAYEKSDDVMTGYELRINGYKMAWSMKDYMDALEEKFHHVLYEELQEHKSMH
jgi:F-type H+-transporting ATPase subunit b